MVIKILMMICCLVKLPEISGYYLCGPSMKCKCESIISANGTSMDCKGTRLANFSDICENLGNATFLDASYNNISSLSDDDIEGCKDLLSLSLRYNNISDIVSSVFQTMSELTHLDLSHNFLNIYTNRYKQFEYLLELKSLKLNGNFKIGSEHNQNSIYPDLSANRKLTTLHLDGLQSGYFDDSYKQLKQLKILDISGGDGVCYISYIDNSFFTNLIHLEHINMSHCQIRYIEFDAFTLVPNLTNLDLAYNQNLGLRSLYNTSHGLQFTNIQMLNYSYVYHAFGLGKKLTKIDLCFLRNTTLREIVLDGNRLEQIETNALILMPSTLNVAHVKYNKLNFGPYILQLSCSSNLTDLNSNFQYSSHTFSNYIRDDTDVEPNLNDTGHCPYLEETYMKNISANISNCIYYEPNDTIVLVPSLPNTLKRFHLADSSAEYDVGPVLVLPLHKQLEYIDVSGNILQKLIGPVGPVEKLKYVDLSRNYCTYISETCFEYMSALENLQIHSNYLGLNMSKFSHNSVFRHLTNLRTMNLSINKITTLYPNLLEGLVNLLTLDLSFNSIDSWTLNVTTLDNLSTIFLQSNSLSGLPLDLMNHMDKVANRLGQMFKIDLRNNKLRYKCENQQFLEWLVKHRSSFVGFDEYEIVDDDGKTIKSADLEAKVVDLKKQCRSYTVWIVLSTIGFSAALSVIVGSILYKNRWKIRYFMYMSKQRFYGYVRVPNGPPVENYKFDAFISYADENLRFVKDEVIPKVEKDGVALCVHQRNFMAGNFIADNIIDAIKSSRKTVVLVSEAFLKRKWCIYEFNMARMESIYSRDGRSCLLIVLLGKVPPKHMPLEMVEWMKNESYIEYTTEENGEELFWNSLIDAVRSS